MADRILVYGYGNPGRQDDGLGPALIDRLETEPIKGVATMSNYQLNIEDALEISDKEAVIFVDASVSCQEPFQFYGIEPDIEITFTTHSMSPQSVLALCGDLYEKDVKAYILSIRGYDWDFAEGLSGSAGKNLDEAYGFLRNELHSMLCRETDSRVNLIN